MAGEIPQPLAITYPELLVALTQWKDVQDIRLRDIQSALQVLPQTIAGLAIPLETASWRLDGRLELLRTGLTAQMLQSGVVVADSLNALPSRTRDAWRDLPSEKLAAALVPGSAPGAVAESTLAGIYDAGVSYAKKKGPGVPDHLVEDAQGKIEAWLNEQLAAGPVPPEQVLARVGKTLGFQSGIGLAAHGVSTVLSLDVLGCLDLNATGLAAAIAEFAGFGPACQAIQAPFYSAFLRQPWTYNVNRMLRPAIMGPMDLTRLRGKRLFGRESWSIGTWEDFKKYMSYNGFSDAWIDAWEADLYKEPRYFELNLMMDDPASADDTPWMRQKALMMQYDERDALALVGGLKARRRQDATEALLRLYLERVDLGEMDQGEFAAALASLPLPSYVRSDWQDVAGERWQVEYIKNSIYEAKQSYRRDELTDEEFRYVLEGIGLRQEKVDLICRIERVKRFHKVWRVKPDEAARANLNLYRQAYRAGAVPRTRLVAEMLLAGLEDDVIDTMLSLDDLARDKTVVSDFREWQLPPLRDKVLDGRLTLAAYRAALAAADFPARYLDAEVALAEVLAAHAKTARLERRSIPDAEKAYIYGLTVEALLRNLYDEAAWTKDEQDLRLRILDVLRTAEQSSRDRGAGGARPAGPTRAEMLAQAEYDYIEGRITETELRAIYLKLAVPPDRAEARIKALRPMRR